MDPTSSANILPALLARLGQIPPLEQQTNDNSSLQKIMAPNEQVGVTDAVSLSVAYPTALLWGGTGVTAGWVWGGGQWG